MLDQRNVNLYQLLPSHNQILNHFQEIYTHQKKETASKQTYAHDAFRCHVFARKVVNKNKTGTRVQGTKTNKPTKNSPIAILIEANPKEVDSKYADAPSPTGDNERNR